MFVAMNSPPPACPKCGSVKVEDFGVTTFDLGKTLRSNFGISSSDSAAKQSDKNLRRIADRYELTDMNNKDGQAVKRAAPAAPASGRVTSIGGYQVPESAAAGCHRLPVTAKLKGPQIQGTNMNKSPMLKGMTRVVAEHKGKA